MILEGTQFSLLLSYNTVGTPKSLTSAVPCLLASCSTTAFLARLGELEKGQSPIVTVASGLQFWEKLTGRQCLKLVTVGTCPHLLQHPSPSYMGEAFNCE